jgi:hypothetical protein
MKPNKLFALILLLLNGVISFGQNASVDFGTNYKVTFASNKILINGQNPSNLTLYNQSAIDLDISDVSLKGLDLYISTTPDYPFVNNFLQTSNAVIKRGKDGETGSRFTIDILAAKESTGTGNEFHPILYISSRKKPGISNKVYVFNRASNQDYYLINNGTYKRQVLPRNLVSNYANQKGNFNYNMIIPFSYSPFLIFDDLNNDKIDDFILATNNAFYRGNFFNTGGMYLPLYKYLTKNNDNTFNIRNDNEDMSYPNSQPSAMFHNVNRASIIDLNNDGKKEIIGWGEGYHQSPDTLHPEFAKSAGLRDNIDFKGDTASAYNKLMYLKKLTFYEISNGKLVDKRNLVPDGIPLSASLFGSAGDIEKDGDNDIIVVSDGVWRIENTNYQFSLTKILNSEVADFMSEGFQRRISTMLPYLVDVNQDGYGDLIFSLEKLSGAHKPNRIVYALNNKNKGFAFNDLKDFIPYSDNASKDNYLNYVLSDVYAEDINKNGTQEVVFCFAKEFSTVGNENPYPSQQYYRIVEITSNGTIIDQTSSYFEGTTNNIKVSSKNGGNFQFVNMDADPELEIIPYFNALDPTYYPFFPKEGWYGYWNNYTGFQYFDLVNSKYQIKRLGNLISYSDDNSTGKPNSIKINETYANGQFMFHDFDKDGKNEILLTGNNTDQLLQPTVDFQFNSKLIELKENTPVNSNIDTISVSSPISIADFTFSLVEPNDFIGLTGNKLIVKAAIDFETIKTKKIVVPIKVTNTRYNTFTIIERTFNVMDVLENSTPQPSQNNFRNGTSPSTFRFLMPDQANNGYNHIMYQTEGLDGLNYFGNRLEDYDLDGKFDIMMRAKEYLDGAWDLPSGNPRIYLKGSIASDYKFTLEKKDVILTDGSKVVYDSLNSKKYVFNYTFQDPTPLNQIGVNNFDLFYQSKGLTKYEDYYFDNDYLWFTPRVYEINNGVIIDVTKTKLTYSDNIKKDVVRFLWPQASSTTDIDGDGDLDIIITARNLFNSIDNFTNNYDSNYQNIIVYKNQGNGTLFADIMDISSIGNFSIQEGNLMHALNMDNDAEKEVLTSISKGNTFTANLTPDREFGYLDFNFQTNSVSFKKIFNAAEFLENPNWSIDPKDVRVLPNKSNRNLLLFFYSDQYGSPVRKLVGTTNFTEGTTMQYFRIYEVVNKNLTNVTSEFFSNNESKTLSLDNSGRVYFIDVDGDGITDIYPQLGSMPYPELGGINQFLKYPSWNGKFNTLYYFKQDSQGKYKLTDLATIENFNYPQNFKSTDFNLFNDNGEYTVNGNTLRLESFTGLNTYSLHDIDKDGKNELLTSSQPDYLNVYTKSDLNYSPVSKYKINESRIQFAANPTTSFVSLYDFSKLTFPSDTAYIGLDYRFIQKFVVKDSAKLITHRPVLLEPKINSKPFTYFPPNLDATEVNNVEHLLAMNFNSSIPDSSGVSYTVPFALPVKNDIYLKKADMILSKKNIAPFPFSIITENRIDGGNFKGFELTLSNSVDINLNEHRVNGNIINGLKYGYELYVNKVLKKTVVFDQNLNYSYDNSKNKTTITGIKIPLEGNTFANATYKVFAVDTYDDKIKTYATKLFCENAPKPVLNTSKYSFCASDTLKLSITNSVKGDKYIWYFGTKVDTLNVTAKSFLETQKVLITKVDSLGCETKTDSLSVTKLAVVATPTISNSSSLTFCAGNNVILTSSGTPNNQWFLNGNAISNSNSTTYTVTSSGVYKVKASTSDCSSAFSSDVTVVVNPIPPTPTITLDVNGSLSSSASNGIQWYFNDVKIDNATQKTIVPTNSGNYTVKVITPCESAISSPYNVVVTSAEETILEQVQVAPNPFSNRFKVSFPVEFGKTSQVKVLDMLGSVHFKKQAVSNGEFIDLGHLSGGNYILHLESNDNSNKKAIKISKVQ